MIAAIALKLAIDEAEGLLVELRELRRRLMLVPGLDDAKAQLERSIARLERGLLQMRQMRL